MTSKKTNHKRSLDDYQLIDATRGIHYRYFQFKDTSHILFSLNKYALYDHIPKLLIQPIHNSIVESWTVNFRCLLEFFDPDKTPSKARDISQQIVAKDYYNYSDPVAEYNKIISAWCEYLSGPCYKNPTIKFNIEEEYNNEYPAKIDYVNLKQVYERLSALVAHQAAWIIKENERKGASNPIGRVNYKVTKWDYASRTFYNGIAQLVIEWLTYMQTNKDHLLHNIWKGITKYDIP